MIEYLRGRIVRIEEGLLVMECGPIGVRVRVRDSERFRKDRGREVRLPVWLEIQTRRLQFYGFADEKERSRFGKLVAIPGIGPASAMRLLPFHDRLVEGKDLPDIPGFGQAKRARLVRWLRRSGLETRPRGLEKDVMQALTALGLPAGEARRACARAFAARPDACLEELVRIAVRKR